MQSREKENQSDHVVGGAWCLLNAKKSSRSRKKRMLEFNYVKIPSRSGQNEGPPIYYLLELRNYFDDLLVCDPPKFSRKGDS